MKKLGKISTGEEIWGIHDPPYGAWIFFDGDEATGQSVASDIHDYRYTHGGNLYREACKLFWDYFS